MIARRALLKAALTGGVALPVAAGLLRTAHAEDEIPMLRENDVTAKSLAYVEDAAKVDKNAFPTYKKGQDCSTCSQYIGDKGEPKGACQLVLGQYVLAKGWCKAWEAKPAQP
jgi:hypothetical protein